MSPSYLDRLMPRGTSNMVGSFCQGLHVACRMFAFVRDCKLALDGRHVRDYRSGIASWPWMEDMSWKLASLQPSCGKSRT